LIDISFLYANSMKYISWGVSKSNPMFLF
jgi:hypothetical protein